MEYTKNIVLETKQKKIKQTQYAIYNIDWRFTVCGFAPGAAGRRGEKVPSAMGLRVDQSTAGPVGRGRRRGRGRRDRQRIFARDDRHWTSSFVVVRSVVYG